MSWGWRGTWVLLGVRTTWDLLTVRAACTLPVDTLHSRGQHHSVFLRLCVCVCSRVHFKSSQISSNITCLHCCVSDTMATVSSIPACRTGCIHLGCTRSNRWERAHLYVVGTFELKVRYQRNMVWDCPQNIIRSHFNLHIVYCTIYIFLICHFITMEQMFWSFTQRLFFFFNLSRTMFINRSNSGLSAVCDGYYGNARISAYMKIDSVIRLNQYL